MQEIHLTWLDYTPLAALVTGAPSLKYLGVWLEDNLKFNIHIKKFETDVAKYAGLFHKIRDFLNINTLKTLYYSL